MNKKILGLSIGVTSMVMVSCSVVEPEVDERVISPPGFQAYISARDFDPPGQVYRVTPAGDIYKVSTLEVDFEKGGEVLPNFRKEIGFSLSALMDVANINRSEFQAISDAEASREHVVILETSNSYREFLQDDSGIYPALTELFKEVPFRDDNSYYLIRETISVDSVNYQSSTGWLSQMGVESELSRILEGKAGIEWKSDKQFALTRDFDTPKRIWYKPESIQLDENEANPGGLLIFDLVATSGAVPDLSKAVVTNP